MPCGHCFYCERDLPILCEPFTRNQPRGFLLDGSSRMSRGGSPVYHYSVTSTHAQYTVVPESGAIPVPADIPFDRACLIGCGVMTGVGAVVRKAKVEAGATVAVIGCGAVGLNAIQGARLVDARQIIAIDLGKAKLDRAALFGATHVIEGGSPDVVGQVKALRSAFGSRRSTTALPRSRAARGSGP